MRRHRALLRILLVLATAIATFANAASAESLPGRTRVVGQGDPEAERAFVARFKKDLSDKGLKFSHWRILPQIGRDICERFDIHGYHPVAQRGYAAQEFFYGLPLKQAVILVRAARDTMCPQPPDPPEPAMPENSGWTEGGKTLDVPNGGTFWQYSTTTATPGQVFSLGNAAALSGEIALSACSFKWYEAAGVRAELLDASGQPIQIITDGYSPNNYDALGCGGGFKTQLNQFPQAVSVRIVSLTNTQNGTVRLNMLRPPLPTYLDPTLEASFASDWNRALKLSRRS